MSDFYAEAAAQRANEISAERAQVLAELERARVTADYATAAIAVQQIANLDADWANLASLHGRYVASQTPPQQNQQRSDVDLTPAEAMKVCGLDPSKAEDVATYQHGQQRLASLKSQGHYRE